MTLHGQTTPSAFLSVAAAVADERVLNTCLGASPEIASRQFTFNAFRGYDSAATALNAAIDSSASEWVALAHQDVYFPSDSLSRLEGLLATQPDNVAVVGLIGRSVEGQTVGQAWSTGMSELVGHEISTAEEVATLDEIVIVVRRSSGLRFDVDLPGFHLYATDIALTARERGLRAVVVPVTVIHHSRPVISLGPDYAAGYKFMKRKWSSSLPVLTMMGDIRRIPFHVVYLDLRVRKAAGFARVRRDADGDPAEIARRLGLN
ncbi:glycosyltransferase family A protein [Microbacterium sp.]|uniref:glycosyltransferase family A protein n=1 Tax=Microbacterium sp. TaxID=51671 RepID=UPI003C71EC34